MHAGGGGGAQGVWGVLTHIALQEHTGMLLEE
jgi:hypothetical protein